MGRKMGGNQWGSGGNIVLDINFSSLEAEMTRRAGTINDASFFEIQMAASHSSAGNVQLFPGKAVNPVSGVKSVQNNKFEVDLVDQQSQQLSNSGRVNVKLNFKYSANGQK